MRRVVDVLPDKAAMEALGLVEKNFWVHPGVYHHYCELFRKDFAVFSEKHREGDASAPGTSATTLPESSPTAADEETLTAFEQSLPRFHYFRGGFYRYRVDRGGDIQRPIILDSFDRDEVTGPVGIDDYTSKYGLFTLLVNRIEKWLIRHDKC